MTILQKHRLQYLTLHLILEQIAEIIYQEERVVSLTGILIYLLINLLQCIHVVSMIDILRVEIFAENIVLLRDTIQTILWHYQEDIVIDLFPDGFHHLD